MSFTERHEELATKAATRVNARTNRFLSGIGDRFYGAGPKKSGAEKLVLYQQLKAAGLLKKEADDAALKAGVSPGLYSKRWIRDVLHMERLLRKGGE